MVQPVSSGISSVHGPTILIVGDTPLIRNNVQAPLQQHQINIIVTSDALHALPLMVDEPPALVLLNEKLPHQDGYHVCQIVRKNLQFRDLPILVLREKEGVFDRIRGPLAGATACLTLPMDVNEFVQIVKKYLNMQNMKE